MSSAAFPVTHRSLRRIGCILIFAAMMMSAVIPDGWSAPGFNQHVRPILAGRCFQCHGPDSGSRKAGLRLDKPQDASLGGKSGKPAIVPGDPGASELLRRITHPDPDLRMPPSELLHPITDQEIRILKEWIESGAKYEVHWAFQPIHRPVIPNHESQSASVNPIDAFIDARLGREGLRRSLPANPRTLLRRLHLDLTGIPPTLEEQESFLKACSADPAHALGERVDQLLASVRFGEHMAAEWLDIARYADTSGFQGDPYRSMWRWRDYVIESFNAGKPFNQFTLEQLAGDLLPNPTLDQHLATGFNRNHRFNTEFGSIDEEWLVEYGVDRVETMGAAWMGLSLGCARCHDHKFDPVTQTEFYQLMALFQNIPERGVYWDGNDAAFAPWIRAPKPDEASKLQALSRASDQAGGALDQRRASQELSVEFSEWESRHSIAARKAVAEMSTAGRSFSPAGVLAIPTNVMVHFAFETGLAARSGQRIESIATSVTTTNKLEEGISVVTTQHDSQLKNTRFDEHIGVAGAGPGLLSEGRLGNGLRLVPNRASLSLSNLVDRGVISIAFWLKPGSSNGFIFHHVAQQDLFQLGIALSLTNARIRFELFHKIFDFDGTMVPVQLQSEETLPLGEWTHLAVVLDGQRRNPGPRLFLNGRVLDVEPAQASARGLNSITNSAPFLVGAGPLGGGINGILDELWVFDRALTSHEIAWLHRLPSAMALAVPHRRRTAVEQQEARDFYADFISAEQARLRINWAKAEAERGAFEAGLPQVMVMRERAGPAVSRLLHRGQYDAPRERVNAGVPQAVGTSNAFNPPNRLGLARWLTSDTHPLTARVLANRLWQRMFGEGLVRTPENFGIQAEPPTHPELLDWLAAELQTNGWDVKALLKQIALSATYQQTSETAPALLEGDPDNRLWGRASRVRLSAEIIRDQALAVSGLLHEKLGGPSVTPYLPGISPQANPDLYRRSVYSFWQRTRFNPSLAVFDAPAREACTVKRPRTNTPLQSLALLNETTYVEASRKLGERMMELGSSLTERVRAGFQLALGRMPDNKELAALEKLWKTHQQRYSKSVEEARKLLSTGASESKKGLDPAEAAAFASVASAILNLDEFVTRE